MKSSYALPTDPALVERVKAVIAEAHEICRACAPPDHDDKDNLTNAVGNVIGVALIELFNRNHDDNPLNAVANAVSVGVSPVLAQTVPDGDTLLYVVSGIATGIIQAVADTGRKIDELKNGARH